MLCSMNTSRKLNSGEKSTRKWKIIQKRKIMFERESPNGQGLARGLTSVWAWASAWANARSWACRFSNNSSCGGSSCFVARKNTKINNKYHRWFVYCIACVNKQTLSLAIQVLINETIMCVNFCETHKNIKLLRPAELLLNLVANCKFHANLTLACHMTSFGEIDNLGKQKARKTYKSRRSRSVVCTALCRLDVFRLGCWNNHTPRTLCRQTAGMCGFNIYYTFIFCLCRINWTRQCVSGFLQYNNVW